MRIIKLDGYNATVDNGKKLELGTFDSYGEEQLQIVKAPDWENLSVIATFNPPNKKPVQAVVDSVTGVIKVPKEATADLYGVGTIVFVGLSDGVQRISVDVEYIVRKHSNASGTEPAEPTPSVVEQILTEAQSANLNSAKAKKLADGAKEIAKSVRDDADNGKFNGAKGDTGAAGKDGLTPHIGENGNWWIGDTDTGESAKGVKGDTGAKGEKGDPGAQGPAGKDGVQIDDAAVRDDAPWSSKNIVDMLCPPLEESGNPVLCYPVAGYPLGVKAKWEPTQEGSGTPYPAGGGKNLLDVNKCTTIKYKPYGLTSTLDGDVFKISGIPNEEVTAKDFYSFSFCTCSQEELRGKGNKVTAWTIKGTVKNAWGLRTESEDGISIAAELTPGVNTDIQFRMMVSKDTPTAWEPYENIRPIKGRDSVKVERYGENLLNLSPENIENGAYKNGEKVDGIQHQQRTLQPIKIEPGKYLIFTTFYKIDLNAMATFFTSDSEYLSDTTLLYSTPMKIPEKARFLLLHSSTEGFSGTNPMLIVGTTAPTTYTPYIGQTNTLTLPETVYGGEVDAVRGEGIKNWRKIVYDGTENWNVRTANYTSYSLALPMRALTGFCTHFKKILYDAIRPDTGTGETGCYLEFSSTAIFNAPYENVGDWKNFLATQYAAGTPVCIVYQYANEVNEPFTATGAQPLPALAGVNTVLTDADSATVTGRADPIKRITDLEDAVASQT